MPHAQAILAVKPSTEPFFILPTLISIADDEQWNWIYTNFQEHPTNSWQSSSYFPMLDVGPQH
jgi:hypothetical protein